MLVKGLVITALLATTPFAFVATQAPQRSPQGGPERSDEVEARRDAEALRRARQELDAARAELLRLRQQLDQALDALERGFEPQRHRNCTPSRSRALLSHWHWLHEQGHAERAAATLQRVVAEFGDDPNRLNAIAWDLMTDDATAGRYDAVALAIAERLAAGGRDLPHHHLDTMALAWFLNGDLDRAVALQQQAIAAGGGGEARRRLRTYEAARTALAREREAAAAAASPTMVAGGG